MFDRLWSKGQNCCISGFLMRLDWSCREPRWIFARFHSAIRASSSMSSSRKSPHKRPNHRIESAVLIAPDDPRQSSLQIADVLCDDNAVLAEKTADLIDEPGAISNQATANPMNGMHGLYKKQP